MALFSATLVLLLASCASATVVTRRHDCKHDEGKCTPKEPRKKLYPHCMFENKTSILWCNHSNYTKIPDPDQVKKGIYQPCKHATTLDISDSCLIELDGGDLKKYPLVKTLKCGRNLITRIRPETFTENKELEHIDFCTNKIRTIETKSFIGLTKLQTLIIDNNELDELDPTMLGGLKFLQEVYFHNNEIAVLHSRTFLGMQSLKVLVLTANKIAHIDEHAFVGLDSLTHLHLDDNRLQRLNRDTFSRLPKLQVLSLSFNKFEVWPEFGQSSLTNVHTLNLAHNLLEEFISSNIANLSKLQNLSLENNSLQALPEDLFLHVPNLRYLNVSKNRIEAIGQYAFSRLCHLETLDIHDNNLKIPYAEWFSRIVENGIASGTNVSGNKWSCDCAVIQYEEFVSTQDARWKKVLRIMCDYPKKIYGKSLDSAVVETILDGEKCANKDPYVKSDRECSENYSFTRKADVYTYAPTVSEQTTGATSFGLNDPTTFKDDDKTTAEEKTPHSENLDANGTDTLAVSLIGVALLLLLGIIAVSALCICKHKRIAKRNICEDIHDEKLHTENSRSDLESGLYDKLQRDPVVPKIVGSVSQSPQSGFMQENENLSGATEEMEESLEPQSAADPYYVSMQTVSTENTVPKIPVAGSRETNFATHEPETWRLLAVRRQPDGASFKRDNT